MKRRDFLRTSGMATLCACATGLPGIGRAFGAQEQPNILFIMTDQQTAAAMSCTGMAGISTPAMDRIAASGVRFEHAYCAQPLCIPSRTSIFTGRMPAETGICVNDYDNYVGGLPIMGSVFKDAGYDTGYIGKWHLPVANTAGGVHGFDTVKYAVDNGIDTSVPQACVDFINQSRTAPFLLVASFVNPHDICEWARGDAMKNGDIPDPPAAEECPELPDNFDISDDEPDIVRYVQTLSDSTYPTVGWETDKWRQYQWAYRRLTETVDTRIGQVLDALETAGAAGNTLVVFTSDHGDGCGAHQWNQKQILFDEAARIPFVISSPGMARGGETDDAHLVSNALDLIPTLCDYAGIAAPASLAGRSLKTLAETGSVADWRDHLVVETEFCPWQGTYGITGRMVRTDRYKYIAYSQGTIREALYDMQDDPGETVNLALVPEHADRTEAHRAYLRTYVEQVGDTFEVPATPVSIRQGSADERPAPGVTVASGSMNIHFSLRKPERVTMSLFNLAGTNLHTEHLGRFGAGTHSVNVPMPAVSGTLMWRIDAGGRRMTGKLFTA